MPKLLTSLQDWNTERFARTFKVELKGLPPGSLPLDQGVTQGGYVDDTDIDLVVLRVADCTASAQAHFGIFFTEIVACCGCGDDPMRQSAYCELQVTIDKATAEAKFQIVATAD
ncbi:MAG: hypothetical protein WCZ87_11225 [Thiohalobacteraceae bacterium]